MECRHQPGISVALRKRKGLQTEPKIIALSSNPDMFCEMQKAIPNLAFQAGPSVSLSRQGCCSNEQICSVLLQSAQHEQYMAASACS